MLFTIFVYIGIAPIFIYLSNGIRGIVLTVAAGWLTLSPIVGINIPGLPKLTKDFAVSYAIAIGTLAFKGSYLSRFRFSILDFFVILAVITPFLSAVLNGLGAWDGCSEMYGRFFIWGVPYFAGRCFVHNLDDVNSCAVGILIAGLIAVPLCLIEIRLSPQLHRWVYGTHAAPFHMAKRLGGYRPTLMFRHGIEVGTWLACSGIIGVWLALISPKARLFRISIVYHAVALVLTNILSRSLGSIMLLTAACASGFVARFFQFKLIMILLVIAVPSYITVRITDIWSPEGVVDLIAEYIDADRAVSLSARIYQEGEIGAKARQRFLFGWGGHNRFRVFDEYGEGTTAVDPLWLITFGKYGLSGIIGIYGMLCASSIIIVFRTPCRLLFHKNMAGPVGLILAMFIATTDSLQNAFFSPLMVIAAGALTTTAISLHGWLPSPNGPRRAPARLPVSSPAPPPLQSANAPTEEK